MKYNRLFLVSLAILTIFMLSAVSATDDVSVDNLTVEETNIDSIEEICDDVELSENEENDLMDSSDSGDVVSDKKTVSMDLSIVGQGEGPIFSVDESGFEIFEDAKYYVKVKLSDKVNGTYSLYIDNKFIENKDVTSTTHYLTLNELSTGKHVVKLEYSGNDEYLPTSSELTYEVIPGECNIWYDENLIYGNTLFLVEIGGNNPTGNVVAVIDGKRYTAPVIRSLASFEIPVLSEGNHKLHIDYLGDSGNAPTSDDGELYVNYGILYTDYFVGYNQNNFVSLRLPNNAKGNLLVKVDGETVGDVKLVNGYASVSLNDFKEIGKYYRLDAEYTGTDYDVSPPEYDEGFIIVPKIDFEHELIQNQQYTLTFTLPNTYSGDLKVDFPGYDDSVNVKVVNGKASVPFYAKGEGISNISVNYVDVDGYSYEDEDLFVFIGPNPNMVATVESKVGQNPVFRVNVANDAGGAISVLINGKEYTSSYFTKSGSLVIPGLADGKYTATVIYSGDYKYPSVSKTITFTKTSKSSKTKISLKLSKVTVKKSAKKLVLKATLKINGKVAKGKKITFKFNKKTYKAKTNKKGVAKVTIKKSVLKKLKVGKKVKYQASYGKTTVKKTVKVKK